MQPLQTSACEHFKWSSCSEDLSLNKGLNNVFSNRCGMSGASGRLGLLRISCMEPFYVLFMLCLQNTASLRLHLIFSLSDEDDEVCYRRVICPAKKIAAYCLFFFNFKFQVTPNLHPSAWTLRHQLLSWQWMGGCWHGDRCESHSLLHNYFLCSWIRFHFKHPPPPAWQVWRHRWLSHPRHSLNIDRTSTQIKTRALCKRLQAHFFF